jgi:pectin methylesterase-like acyl-CoA thioesterase
VNNHSNEGFGTSGSATMFVYGHDSALTNLTVSNDYEERDAENQQAVALNLNADRSVLRNVRLLGDQDTFQASKNARAYLVDSYVEGTVDFVFGEGTLVVDRSTIHEKRASGATITAAKTPAGRTYGFLFYESTITGTTAGKTYLGRPWGPDAQVLFRECSLSDVIKTSQPWTDMSGNSWQGARFREYKNTGAGAATNSNRKQLSDSEAANYTPAKYLAGGDGWNPFGAPDRPRTTANEPR